MSLDVTSRSKWVGEPDYWPLAIVRNLWGILGTTMKQLWEYFRTTMRQVLEFYSFRTTFGKTLATFRLLWITLKLWNFRDKIKLWNNFETTLGQLWEDFEHMLRSRFWSWRELKRESGSWSLVCFFCWCFVEVMKLCLGWDSEARFGQDYEV